MRLRILGASVSVIFDSGVSAAQRAELRRAWSRCLEEGEDLAIDCTSTGRNSPVDDDGSTPPFRARILRGAAVVPVSGVTFEGFAAELTSALTLAAIEQRGGELLMLHASGLSDPRTGRTAALVGPSGIGKTTATRVLARGLGYVSDETVGIEPGGSVVPYPKPLSVIVDEPPDPKRQLGPDALGLRAAPTPGSLGAVVLLERERSPAGSGRAAEVRPLSHAEAIVGLAPHTSSLGKLRRPLQLLCELLDACGGGVSVAYREAEDLAGLIPGLLARPPVAGGWAPAVVPLPRADDGDLPPGCLPPGCLPPGCLPPGSAAPGHLRRGDVVDAVEIAIPGGGSELLVMVGQRVLRLGGIVPALWRAVGSPARFEDLAARIAPEVGLPSGHEEALSRAVELLVDYGVLTRS
ncbi:hypothetical protein [Sinomonas humi]|uniref:hypothetical protein n=1 Tax=Sinomonas humi TaxID=1338436 RepID=UPI00068BDFD7|nr:hypothetical protein [Sinomonas humi]